MTSTGCRHDRRRVRHHPATGVPSASQKVERSTPRSGSRGGEEPGAVDVFPVTRQPPIEVGDALRANDVLVTPVKIVKHLSATKPSDST